MKKILSLVLLLLVIKAGSLFALTDTEKGMYQGYLYEITQGKVDQQTLGLLESEFSKSDEEKITTLKLWATKRVSELTKTAENIEKMKLEFDKISKGNK